MHHHIDNLLLRRTACAYYRQLNLHRRKLHHRQSLVGRSQKHNAACLSYRNRCSHVAVKKQLFDAQQIRLKVVDNIRNIIINLLQPQLRQHILISQHRAVKNGAQTVACHIYQTITADGGTGVNS